MSTEPLIEQLQGLHLRGMAAALEQQKSSAAHAQMPFEERLKSLIQHEMQERAAYRFAQRLRWARLPEKPALTDIDTRGQRGLDPKLFSTITGLEWIGQHMNVLITGAAGVGKSFLACALGHAACNAEYSVRFFRMAKLMDELARYASLKKSPVFARQLAKADLLIIDDFGLTPLNEQMRHELLEILDSRYTKRSTIVTSQLPVEQWKAYLGEPTIADAILDRLVHNAHRIALQGESMRKAKAVLSEVPADLRSAA